MDSLDGAANDYDDECSYVSEGGLDSDLEDRLYSQIHHHQEYESRAIGSSSSITTTCTITQSTTDHVSVGAGHIYVDRFAAGGIIESDSLSVQPVHSPTADNAEKTEEIESVLSRMLKTVRTKLGFRAEESKKARKKARKKLEQEQNRLLLESAEKLIERKKLKAKKTANQREKAAAIEPSDSTTSVPAKIPTLEELIARDKVLQREKTSKMATDAKPGAQFRKAEATAVSDSYDVEMDLGMMPSRKRGLSQSPSNGDSWNPIEVFSDDSSDESVIETKIATSLRTSLVDWNGRSVTDAVLVSSSENESQDGSDVCILEPGPSKPQDWKISDKDLKDVNDNRRRYFTKRNSVECRNCRMNGHISKYCPQPKKSILCSLCGEVGHLVARCPNFICFVCGRQDHDSSRCYVGVSCKLCGRLGHRNTHCPDKWRIYHSKTSEEDRIRLVHLKPRRDASCFNCAAQGHYGHECKSQRMTDQILPNSPTISQRFAEANGLIGCRNSKPAKFDLLQPLFNWKKPKGNPAKRQKLESPRGYRKTFNGRAKSKI